MVHGCISTSGAEGTLIPLKVSEINILSSYFAFLLRLKSVIYVHSRWVEVLITTSKLWGEYGRVIVYHSASHTHTHSFLARHWATHYDYVQ